MRDRVAGTIVRLLPPQPKPARRFAPVPATRSEERTIVVWLDRELIWAGPEDDLRDGLETFPFDRLGSEPGLPPWTPHPLDGRELCVGVAFHVDTDGHLEDGVVEMDCDFTPLR